MTQTTMQDGHTTLTLPHPLLTPNPTEIDEQQLITHHPSQVDFESETTFGYDEMFFSHTDNKGVIRYGNEVFSRIAEYPLTEMVGKPHNIIRHPDMPRAVFRLLWDTIDAGNTIIAYVKNRARSGKFYWVMAMVFPCQGYLSIRIRPGSPLFYAVQPVYQEMFKIEKTGGMDAAATYLMSVLASLGYPSYTEFMTDALIAEIQHRKTKLPIPSTNHTDQILQIESIWTLSKQINDRTTRLSALFSRITFYCLNLTIKSTKYGKDGDGISIISTVFQERGDEITALFTSFAADQVKFNDILNSVRLALGCGLLQSQMTDYFANEHRASDEYQKILSEIDLNELARAQTQSALARLHTIFVQFKSNATKLKQGFLALKIIRLNSRVETAGLPDGGAQVKSIIDEISDFLLKTNIEIDCIESEIQQLNQLIGSLSKMVNLA